MILKFGKIKNLKHKNLNNEQNKKKRKLCISVNIMSNEIIL